MKAASWGDLCSMVLLPKRLKARVLERHERTTKTTVNDGSKGLGFGVLMSQKKGNPE